MSLTVLHKRIVYRFFTYLLNYFLITLLNDHYEHRYETAFKIRVR